MSDLHVLVRVAGEDYALAVADVLEVTELGEITPVPGAGAEVLGVRNLRGQVLTVIDLASVLGLAGSRPDHIVVAEQGGLKGGMAVDSVAGVEPLPDALQQVESRHLAGAALTDGALVGVIDVSSVLHEVAGASAR